MSAALAVLASVVAYWTGRKRPVERARAWNIARIVSDTPRPLLDSIVWFLLHPVEGSVRAREMRAEREETESVDFAHELFGARDAATRR